MNIVVIATLDTKGEEAGFIRGEIVRLGHTPIVIDPDLPANQLFLLMCPAKKCMHRR